MAILKRKLSSSSDGPSNSIRGDIMESEPKPTNLPATDFFKFDLRAGTILTIEPVAKSKKLLKLEVSFGPTIGNRTILAGIASGYDVNNPNTGRVIVGQKIVAVLNLEPRPMMGIDSHGMLLAAHSEDGAIWLANPGPVQDGAEVG
jgi:methionyl-tRNA synthetase